MKQRLDTFFVAAFAAILFLAGAARAEMIRELVTLQGSPPIPVEGIGIVTGLANTGDKKDAALLLLREYMANNNLNFDTSSLAVGNIALVRVNAELPPFLRPGKKFSVRVTSIGDAKSLQGGELLHCKLFDNMQEENGEPRLPLAVATGQVVVGSGLLTRGTIPAGESSGALQASVYPEGRVMDRDGIIRLNLDHPNHNDAATIARQINQTPFLNPNLVETTMFAEAENVPPIAIAKDPGQVVVRIPEQYRTTLLQDYIGSILDVPVSINRPAKILVNRAQNSIVVTGDIRVNNAMVSLQDKMVTVRPETPEEPASYTLEDATPRNLVELEGPGSYADLQGLIDTLNAMGLTTEQVITVFEQLRAAGAIRAELVAQ